MLMKATNRTFSARRRRGGKTCSLFRSIVALSSALEKWIELLRAAVRSDEAMMPIIAEITQTRRERCVVGMRSP
jgi:hypothetical protein